MENFIFCAVLAIHRLDKIIITYFEAMREELGLPEDQKCLLIYSVLQESEPVWERQLIILSNISKMYERIMHNQWMISL